jgi:UDP-GlcNAc:undecaprenyl-phosphate GlcNAc-1-phosphate transferase
VLTYLVAFLLSATASMVLTPVARDLALKYGAVDPGTEQRKVHKVPTPRVGGVAIAVAFFIPTFALLFWDNRVSEGFHDDSGRYLGLVLGALAMVGLGLVDDIRGLSAKTKFAVQLLVAVGAYATGYQITGIGTPFGPIDLGLLALPVTVLWIVGIVNAMNLIDGLDGLASGIALFTVTVLFVLGVLQPNVIVGLTAISLAGALLGFLRYNFNPASIFMGDSGSLFLGYVLSVTAISGAAKSSTVVSLLIPLLALGLPVFDTSLAIVRRFISGKRIFSADRGHVHHRLLDRGLTHRQAVLVLYAGCAFLGLGALGLVWATRAQAAMILILMGVGAIVFSRALGYLSWEEYTTSFRYGLRRQQRLPDRLERIAAAAAEIRSATSHDDAVDALVRMAADIDVDRFECRFAVTGGERLERWSAVFPEDSENRSRYELEYPLDGARDGVEVTGTLSLAWNAVGEKVRVPEAGLYDWLALVLRDRVLDLSTEGRLIHLRPKLQSLPPGR